MNKDPVETTSWRPDQHMDPNNTYRFRVPIHRLVQDVTPTSDHFVLAHFGVPKIKATDWRLHIGGLVRAPTTLSLATLRNFRKREVQSFLKCAGFPHKADINTHNVSNAVWAGADLGEVLNSVGVDPKASFIWSYGSDHGTYADWRADEYVKDLPMSRLADGDVLLAYELNGEPLPAVHGFPVRLFVPGFYGTNSVKWLCRIEVSDRRAPGLFTTQLYNDPSEDSQGGGQSTAVWQAPPESIIVAPQENARLSCQAVSVWGWCWGADPIRAVEVSSDDGRTWRAARVGPRSQYSWQAFQIELGAQPPGETFIVARAEDIQGRTQPARAARNSCHRIKVCLT